MKTIKEFFYIIGYIFVYLLEAVRPLTSIIKNKAKGICKCIKSTDEYEALISMFFTIILTFLVCFGVLSFKVGLIIIVVFFVLFNIMDTVSYGLIIAGILLGLVVGFMLNVLIVVLDGCIVDKKEVVGSVEFMYDSDKIKLDEGKQYMLVMVDGKKEKMVITKECYRKDLDTLNVTKIYESPTFHKDLVSYKLTCDKVEVKADNSDAVEMKK